MSRLQFASSNTVWIQKKAALHSTVRQVYKGQQIEERWKICLMYIWKKWNNEIQY